MLSELLLHFLTAATDLVQMLASLEYLIGVDRRARSGGDGDARGAEWHHLHVAADS